MMQGNKLQDEVMAKEEAKIKMRQEANAQRLLRIRDARARTMGLDVNALDAQVEEKNKLRRAGLDNDDLLKQQAIEIERIVALAKEEEKQLKEFQNNELKKSWQESIHKKKENENYLRSIKDIDYERAGPSSAISFTGEDGLRSERNKLQKDQMRRWVQEQMHEKAFQKKLDKEEDMAQAAIIRTVDNIREATEKEEQELSRFGRQSVLAQNADLAKIQAEKRAKARADMYDSNTKTSLDLFNEDKTTAINEKGRVVRVDMFKGYTAEQRRKILQENEEVMRQQRLAKEQMNSDEYDWMVQQTMTLRAMENADYEERRLREASKQEHLQYLRDQIAEQAKIKEEWKKTKNGSIEAGFYSGFGNNCR